MVGRGAGHLAIVVKEAYFDGGDLFCGEDLERKGSEEPDLYGLGETKAPASDSRVNLSE